MINLTMNMKNRILLGVYAIYCMRKLRSPLVAESFVFAIIAAILLYFVSVPSVLTNMSASENSYHYFIMAFSGTNFVVQSILVAGLITTAIFVRNLTFRTTRLKQRFT